MVVSYHQDIGNRHWLPQLSRRDICHAGHYYDSEVLCRTIGSFSLLSACMENFGNAKGSPWQAIREGEVQIMCARCIVFSETGAYLYRDQRMF